MHRKEAVVSHGDGGIFRGSESNVITEEVSAGGICGSESPKVGIPLCGYSWKAGGVLRDGLHGPLKRVTGDIFHPGAKVDAGRVRVQANCASELDAGLRVRGAD